MITSPHLVSIKENDGHYSLIEAENTYEQNKRIFSMNRPGLHPTEASVEYLDSNNKLVVIGHCLRAAWYRSMEIPKVNGVNVSLLQKAYLGKWDEVGVVTRWKEMGIWVGNNIKFFNRELVLSGELDTIIKDPSNGKLIGVEIKTFYGYPANKSLCGSKRDRRTKGSIPGRPKDEHFLQAALYAWEYRSALDEYRLYYLERGDGHRIEFKIMFEENADGTHTCCWEQVPGPYWNSYVEGIVRQPYTIEDVHARYKKLIGLLRSKTLPPKDFDKVWDNAMVEYMYSNGRISETDYENWQKNPSKNKLGDWHCSYCDYQDQCIQDDLTA